MIITHDSRHKHREIDVSSERNPVLRRQRHPWADDSNEILIFHVKTGKNTHSNSTVLCRMCLEWSSNLTNDPIEHWTNLHCFCHMKTPNEHRMAIDSLSFSLPSAKCLHALIRAKKKKNDNDDGEFFFFSYTHSIRRAQTHVQIEHKYSNRPIITCLCMMMKCHKIRSSFSRFVYLSVTRQISSSSSLSSLCILKLDEQIIVVNIFFFSLATFG